MVAQRSVAVDQCSPSLEQARAAWVRGERPCLSRDVLSDLDTPVSAYLKIRGSGASFLLESVEGGERIGRYSFMGAAPRRIVRVKDGVQRFDDGACRPCADPLDAVRELVEAYGRAPQGRVPFEGGALGYLSYEAVLSFERLPRAMIDPLGLPDAAFMDVDTLLVFDHVAHTIRIIAHLRPGQSVDCAYQDAVERIESLAGKLAGGLDAVPPPLMRGTVVRSNVAREVFEGAVATAKEHIEAGDILQVVLSQRLSMPLEGDPFGFYRQLRRVSPSPYMYYLNFGDHQIVGASPELLVEVKGSQVTTIPIAGTRRRGASPEEDAALAADLLDDEKERAEHLMLVDLARNDVGRVSVPGTVRVGRFMEVERFSHVMHLVSEVTGALRPDRSSYDVLRAAFPAGTVSGAPKIRAMQIISELEPDCRGAYAGAVGFFNTRGDMELAITIRTGVVKDGALHVQVGAGIVADSDPAGEFVETMNKARALLEAAGAE